MESKLVAWINCYKLTGLKVGGTRICKKRETKSSAKYSVERCLEIIGDILLFQGFNNSFLSIEIARHLNDSDVILCNSTDEWFAGVFYLCADFGHSIFGLSIIAINRLMAIARGGWKAGERQKRRISTIGLCRHKLKKSVQRNHEVTSVEFAWYNDATNQKHQAYRGK